MPCENISLYFSGLRVYGCALASELQASNDRLAAANQESFMRAWKVNEFGEPGQVLALAESAEDFEAGQSQGGGAGSRLM